MLSDAYRPFGLEPIDDWTTYMYVCNERPLITGLRLPSQPQIVAVHWPVQIILLATAAQCCKTAKTLPRVISQPRPDRKSNARPIGDNSSNPVLTCLSCISRPRWGSNPILIAWISLASENWLTSSVVCVKLRDLAVLMELRLVTDAQTDVAAAIAYRPTAIA